MSQKIYPYPTTDSSLLAGKLLRLELVAVKELDLPSRFCQFMLNESELHGTLHMNGSCHLPIFCGFNKCTFATWKGLPVDGAFKIKTAAVFQRSMQDSNFHQD